MKNFFTILITLILSSNISFAVSSNITKFVFTTDVQSISKNIISDEITVQTQNSNGEIEKVDETNDVTFLSSSATGEFLNSSGGNVTTTMSKNTSSRTFYYRDSTDGSHTITVKIKGRDTGKEFTTSQKINIGTVTSSNSSSNEQSTTVGSQSSANSSSDYSAHSAQESISSFEEEFDYKVSIGRKRIALINTPIHFEPKFSGLPQSYSRPSFDWIFGDGTSSYLEFVNHSYKFPGEYVVILNANISGKKAVSRTEVRVIEPKILIKDFKIGEGGYVSLFNEGDVEVNLDGWIVKSPNTVYFIPQDTIIKAKTSIKMPYLFKDYPIIITDPASNIIAQSNNNVFISYKTDTVKENGEAQKLFYQKYNELNQEKIAVPSISTTTTAIITNKNNEKSSGEQLLKIYEEKKNEGYIKAFFASPTNPIGRLKRWLGK